jgi:hypothetical protein
MVVAECRSSDEAAPNDMAPDPDFKLMWSSLASPGPEPAM